MGIRTNYGFDFDGEPVIWEGRIVFDDELLKRGQPEEEPKEAPSLAQRLAGGYLEELRKKLDDKNAQITELTHELEDTKALLLETESDLNRAQGKLEVYQELFHYAHKHKEEQ